MKFILASNSPRRRELLSLAGIEYTVIPSECDEILPENIKPADAVEELARQKAADVFSKNKDAVIIAADTVVAMGDTILGKPVDVGFIQNAHFPFRQNSHCLHRCLHYDRKSYRYFSLCNSGGIL